MPFRKFHNLRVYRANFLNLKGPRAPSQNCVSGGFHGVLPFRPTYRLARLDMSEILLKGTLN